MNTTGESGRFFNCFVLDWFNLSKWGMVLLSFHKCAYWIKAQICFFFLTKIYMFAQCEDVDFYRNVYCDRTCVLFTRFSDIPQ